MCETLNLITWCNFPLKCPRFEGGGPLKEQRSPPALRSYQRELMEWLHEKRLALCIFLYFARIHFEIGIIIFLFVSPFVSSHIYISEELFEF